MGERPLTPIFALERERRVLARTPDPGRSPQPTVAKLLHYQDRDLLLQTARKAGPFQVEGGRANLFPDFTKVVQYRWATFLGVKRALCEEGLRNQMSMGLARVIPYKHRECPAHGTQATLVQWQKKTYTGSCEQSAGDKAHAATGSPGEEGGTSSSGLPDGGEKLRWRPWVGTQTVIHGRLF
ncbi:hypothetical protein NDU88_003202 [Pleurodeles waltl]|uniref:Uncharacterized protein n=1 Tax=Pleurodeles waltl TaxID=8319 RepID=A0AAV7T5I4_PLEWA|nr:hypothetical protein NDU88_003202 [Pleurodeles waltl]